MILKESKKIQCPGLSGTCLGNCSVLGTVAPPGGRTLPEVQPEEPGYRGGGWAQLPSRTKDETCRPHTQTHAFTGTPASPKQPTQPQSPTTRAHTPTCPDGGVSRHRGTRDPGHTLETQTPVQRQTPRRPRHADSAQAQGGLLHPQTQSRLRNLETPAGLVGGPSPYQHSPPSFSWGCTRPAPSRGPLGGPRERPLLHQQRL